MKHAIFATLAIASLSACGAATIISGTPKPVAPPPATFSGGVGTVNLVQGGGYRFSVPINGAAVDPQASTLPTPRPSTPPTSGNATMTGRYEIAQMTDFALIGGVGTGTQVNKSGNLTLLVNFGTNTISNVGGPLTVNGTYAANQLVTGTVNYLGVPGTLQGLVGSDQALGVFQGAGGTTAYAGGFSAID